MPPDATQAPRNWGLLLMVILSIEFWMIVTSTVAQSF
jgi:hypothetical protein